MQIFSGKLHKLRKIYAILKEYILANNFKYILCYIKSTFKLYI